MYEHQAFVDGMYAFLDYTEPDNLRNNIKEGLMVCRRAQDKEKEFEKRCIQRWAISELAKTIVEDPDNPVEDVAYRFALKLYGYAECVWRCGRVYRQGGHRSLPNRRRSISISVLRTKD